MREVPRALRSELPLPGQFRDFLGLQQMTRSGCARPHDITVASAGPSVRRLRLSPSWSPELGLTSLIHWFFLALIRLPNLFFGYFKKVGC